MKLLPDRIVSQTLDLFIEDGRIRLMNPKDAKVVKEFMPVTVSATAANGR